MATLTVYTPRVVGYGPRIGTVALEALAMVRRWQQRARDRARMGNLDDHLLRDVGLTREMLAMEQAKPFWRP